MRVVSSSSSSSNRLSFLLWSCTTAIIVLFGTLVLFLVIREGTADSEAASDAENLLVKTLIDEISNYSSSVASENQPSVAPPPPRAKILDGPESESQSLIQRDHTVVSVAEEMQIETVRAEVSRSKSIERDYIDWLHSPTAIDAVLEQAQATTRDWTYGWVELGQPKDDSSIQHELSQLDTTVIGRTGTMIRVRFPNEREQLEAIRDLKWTHGLGVIPASEKISSHLSEKLQSTTSTEHPIFITVMSTRSTAEYRQTLRQRGTTVGQFFPELRVFAAVANQQTIQTISTLDFVQSIEEIRILHPLMNTAVPSTGADAIRGIGNSIGEYTGFSGKSVPIAVMDSGLNTNHVSISNFRQSICGKNFVPGEDSDLWYDQDGHGSHVTGILLGNGFYEPKRTGIAPGTEHIRFGRIFQLNGGGAATLWIVNAMNYFSESSSCESERWSDDEMKPLIVNLSLSADSAYWVGKDVISRKLDSMVWSHHQLYVVAVSNSGVATYSNFASAKNSLAVGTVFDNGDITQFSSQGPTFDNRLMPNVVGPGVDVWSATGQGKHDGYISSTGTSMSSPVVAGIATLLMDAAPKHREHPALVRARLMASAIKPDRWFSDEHFPRNNTHGPSSLNAAYGLGVVSARTSILNQDIAEGYTSSSTTVDEIEQSEVAYHDIEVPQGTSRLDVILTWDEPSAESIADTVLNDLDLWVDHDANCGSGACGEHSSLSAIDNVEWVIIDNPEPGTYRLKVHGNRVFTNFRAALAWTIIRGPSTPQLTIETAQDSYLIEDGEDHLHTVELTVRTSGYVAIGTQLYIDCRTEDGLPCESFGRPGNDKRAFKGSIEREDGIPVDSIHAGYFDLGEVGVNEEQKVSIRLFSTSEQNLVVNFMASSWNADSGHASVKFLIEDTDADEELMLPEQPSNDHLDTPIELTDEEGGLEIDTLLASTEGGETRLNIGATRALRSLWYSWTAERAELTSFVISPAADVPGWYVDKFRPQVEVYEVAEGSQGLGALSRLSKSPWSVQWFPKPNQEYRIRVSHSHGTFPLRLSWFVGKVAANDNFAAATVLEGASGVSDGHNLGATLEPEEAYGHLAASIWYRWVAPTNGRWQFQIKDAQLVHLLIFKGDAVGNLRLVSGFYDSGDVVPVSVTEGETYYVMIASPNANSGGWVFDELTWEKSEEPNQGNDYFEHALTINPNETGRLQFNTGKDFSVEPEEPKESGIQTGWLKWKAPADGRYTWYWNVWNHYFEIYQGDSLKTLEPLEKLTSDYGQDEFIVDLKKDEEYFFSVGNNFKSTNAFSRIYPLNWHTLEWGLTPENNNANSALAITDSEGSIGGYTRFATTEPDNYQIFGYSSLWYSYEAEETGWYRFQITSGGPLYRLAAFQRNSSSELSFLGSSLSSVPLGEGITVIVHVVKGEKILLRVGHQKNHQDSHFILSWEPTSTPYWLRYLGRIASGYRDSSNNVISITDPRDMVFDQTGTWLFVSTAFGIQVFERDPDTGSLSFVKELTDVPENVHVTWDPYRDRLYTNKGSRWWIFKPQTKSDYSTLELEYTFQEATANSYHDADGDPVVFMGKDGDYLYKSKDFFQKVYGFSQSSRLEELEASDPGMFSVSPSASGDYWLESQFGSLGLARREIGTGMLRRVSDKLDHAEILFVLPAAMEHDYFFTTRESAYIAAIVWVHSLSLDISEIKNQTNEYFDNFGFQSCTTVMQRPYVPVADVFCGGGIYVIEFVEETGEIKLRDLIINSFQTLRKVPDRFGRLPPEFTIPSSVPVEESPDRKHLYLSTVDTGIFIFDRVGTDALSVPRSSNIIQRLDQLQIADNKVKFGEESVQDGCLTVSDMTIDNVSYTLEDSKWQQREIGTPWEDISDSAESNRVCSRELEETKEYRVIATVSIDGASREYASNFIGKTFFKPLSALEVASGQIDLDALTISKCTKVSKLTLSGTEYTVETSQWQVRASSSEDWSDIDTTKTSRELCPYAPNDDREYRLVGTFLIDDERGYYHSSNTITADD